MGATRGARGISEQEPNGPGCLALAPSPPGRRCPPPPRARFVMPGNTPTGSALAVSAGPASAGGAPVPVLDAGHLPPGAGPPRGGRGHRDAARAGLATVTSFSSACDPPLVSFYIGARLVQLARGAGRHVLRGEPDGHGQEEAAARFARKGADRFGPPTRCEPGPGGPPLLAGATTHLICARHAPRADWFRAPRGLSRKIRPPDHLHAVLEADQPAQAKDGIGTWPGNGPIQVQGMDITPGHNRCAARDSNPEPAD